MHAEIGEEIFLAQCAQSRSPGQRARPRDAAMIEASAMACGFRNSRQCSSIRSPVASWTNPRSLRSGISSRSCASLMSGGGSKRR